MNDFLDNTGSAAHQDPPELRHLHLHLHHGFAEWMRAHVRDASYVPTGAGAPYAATHRSSVPVGTRGAGMNADKPRRDGLRHS